jgi:hypothetical protein
MGGVTLGCGGMVPFIWSQGIGLGVVPWWAGQSGPAYWAAWVVSCWVVHSGSVVPTDGPHRVVAVGPCHAWPSRLGVKPMHGPDEASCWFNP